MGQVKLPAIDQPMTLGLIAKQTRNGLHWHHREVHALMKLRAQIERAGPALPERSPPLASEWRRQPLANI